MTDYSYLQTASVLEVIHHITTILVRGAERWLPTLMEDQNKRRKNSWFQCGNIHPQEKSMFRSPHRLPFIHHVTMLRCNKPVPSVAAAPSPAPLPAFDRFIPAKGAKGRGGRAGILAGGRRRRGWGRRRRVFRDESEYR